MANKLDELNIDSEMQKLIEDGLDINVIPKRIKVEPRQGDNFFLWAVRCLGFAVAVPGLSVIITNFPHQDWINGISLVLLGFLPSICLWIILNTTESYFERLEQDINRAAAEVDTYILQRIELMQSLVRIVNAGLEHELHMMLGTAQARSQGDSDLKRNIISESLNNIKLQIEAYPETRVNDSILELMRRDVSCVSEITAARVLYNDRVAIWNRDIFQWPIKRIVAAQNELTTRIPLMASRSSKEKNRDAYFI